MTRKEITYRELLSKVSANLKCKADEAGKKLDVKTVAKATSERWKKVKSGDDKEFIQAPPGTKSYKSSKSSKKHKKSKKKHSDISSHESEDESQDESDHESEDESDHKDSGIVQHIMKQVDKALKECRNNIEKALLASHGKNNKTRKNRKKKKHMRKTRSSR